MITYHNLDWIVMIVLPPHKIEFEYKLSDITTTIELVISWRHRKFSGAVFDPDMSLTSYSRLNSR